MKISIRFKIFSLIMLFLLILTGLFFKLSYNFFIEDKTNTVQEIQTLQVSKAANDVSTKLGSARALLREASLKLLDPSRGKADSVSDQLLWVEVETKKWKSDALKSGSESTFAGEKKEFWTARVVRVGEKDFVRLQDNILIKRSAGNELTPIVGLFNLSFILDGASLTQGLTEAVVVDAKRYVENISDPKKAVVSGGEEVTGFFSRILGVYPQIWGDRLSNARQPTATIEKDIQGNSLALMSWTPVMGEREPTSLVIVSMVGYDKIQAGFKDFVVQLAVAAFLIAGLSVFAAFGVARHLSLPIERVVEATQILETGDFDVRVEVTQSDEVGDLGRAFNHLGQALQERERQLKDAQGALIQNEKLAALGTLSAGIAHEVKNPLAGILGNAELAEISLAKLASSEQVQKVAIYIDVIKKETKRTRGIIDGLMRFSRKEKAEHEAFDLEVVLHETIALMEHSLNMGGVVLRTNFDPELMQINGHANSVEQVLLNMLQNAGHAMADGGEIEITTKYYSDGDAKVGSFVATNPNGFTGPFCRVKIKDTGSGMTREVMEKIFEPFFTTKGAGVGTGLGLSVTMNILTEHKARVSIDSEPGVGTTFYLDFLAFEPRTAEIQSRIKSVMDRKKGGGGDYSPAADVVKSVPSSPGEPSLSGHDQQTRSMVFEPPQEVAAETSFGEADQDDSGTGASESIGLGSFTERKKKIKGRVSLGTVTNFAIRKPGGKS